MADTDALEREAIRVYRRYAVEVVERYGLCPWAAGARKEGRIAERVVAACDPLSALEPSLALLEQLAHSEQVQIGLFLYPRLSVGRLAFEHFAASLREEDAARRELGATPFALAAFHPDAAPHFETPERLIPFIRRTPDPTLQLVRRDVLERVRGPQGTGFFDIDMLTPQALLAEAVEPVREKIARQNLEAIQRAGAGELEALFEEIRRDRDRSYAALGV